MTLKEFLQAELLEYLPDIAANGCAGGFPLLTFYAQTAILYERHEDEIWALLDEQASDFGYDTIPAFIASMNGANIADMGQLQNLLVWYTVEYYAYQYVAELDELQA